MDANRQIRHSLYGALVMTLLLTGFLALGVLVFGRQMFPAVPVRAAPVLLLPTAHASRPDGEPRAEARLLFQATGWLEPDPHPVRVPARTDGFIETVHALEGETVEVGALLATLESTNARLAAIRAEAVLAEARAELEAQAAMARSAELRIQAAAPAVAAARARHDEAADRVRRLASLDPSDTSADELNEARRSEAEARAELEMARIAEQQARADLDERLAVLRRQEAIIARAEAELREARLALSRTEIRAPISGVVMRRYAAPGMKRMAAMDDTESATVVWLYDPRRLQARIDVPLSEASRVATGQMVRLTLALWPDRAFTARVTRITGEADYQRNTLQVKAALDAPDPRLRPEMLCRAEFWGGDRPDADAGDRPPEFTLWVPEAALEGDDGARAVVWVLHPVEQTLERREVRLGPERRGGLRRVLEGLREGEPVVTGPRDRLVPGRRVRIVEETPR